jgi:HlyD family secretion protein
MKRMGIAVVVVAVIAVVALVAFRNGEEESAPVYQKLAVTQRDIVVSASAAGAIEPIRTIEVKSKASGEIFELRVETGDAVSPGDLLVRVDPRIPAATVRQAQADLDLAKAQLETSQSQLRRSEELYKTQSITEQEWETAKLSVASANAQLVRAERSLEDARISAEDTEVRAPLSGVIIQKNVEVGTVISSATSQVGGGTILLQMANLDTVQVRAMVDETDIGKIQPSMAVTITVDAYPNRPFEGQVLKIEPQATVTQNVTMFPVLVRIPNRNGLLRPGMNTEVEVHVGSREGVIAVANAALRTERDVSSAAEVLGLDPQMVQQQIADARRAMTEGSGEASMGGTAAQDAGDAETIEWRGQRVPIPEGVSAEEAKAVVAKLQSGGDMRTMFQSLSERERAVMRQLGQAAGGGRPGQGRGQRQSPADAALAGGDYIVFVLRDGAPAAVPVRTGLTDLDYSEVMSGLSAGDTVLVLPSAGLLASQREFQERMAGRVGGLPGVTRR